MPIITTEIVECDFCHSIQAKEKATYFRVSGTIYFTHYTFRQKQTTRIVTQSKDSGDTVLCPACMLKLIRESGNFEGEE